MCGIFLVSVFLTKATIFSAEISSKNQLHDVVITWKVQPLLDEENSEVSGLVSRNKIMYFWNGNNLGVDKVALFKIYDKISTMNDGSILVHVRSLDGTGLTDQALLEPHVWQHFQELLRKKNIDVTFRFKDDKKDNITVPKGNPFSFSED